MKKFFIAAAAALVAVSASAQINYELGYLNSKIKESGTDISTSGLYVGASMTVTELGCVKVTPGAYLDFTSGKLHDTKYNFFDVNIPVNFSYGLDLSGDIKGFVYAGPTFVLGLSADAKYESETYNLYKEDSIKRFNILLGGGIGIDYKENYRVSVGYSAGLLDINKRDMGDAIKRNNLNIGVAYLF